MHCFDSEAAYTLRHVKATHTLSILASLETSQWFTSIIALLNSY